MRLEAERLRGLEIDDRVEFGGLHDRQVGGPFALEDSADVGACLAIGIPTHIMSCIIVLLLRVDFGATVAKLVNDKRLRFLTRHTRRSIGHARQ
jgi:hypothetical protein